jgi:hypothetical protein
LPLIARSPYAGHPGVCAGLATATTVVAGTGFAGTARADISCLSGFTPPNVNPDCYVVEMTEKVMAAHGIYNSRGAEGVIIP